MAKKGVKKFYGAFSAKNFGNFDQALIRTPPAVGVAGVAKQEEGHWDRAKMGAGVHFNLATPLSPSCGSGLAVVMEGGRRSPRFCLTGEDRKSVV